MKTRWQSIGRTSFVLLRFLKQQLKVQRLTNLRLLTCPYLQRKRNGFEQMSRQAEASIGEEREDPAGNQLPLHKNGLIPGGGKDRKMRTVQVPSSKLDRMLACRMESQLRPALLRQLEIDA